MNEYMNHLVKRAGLSTDYGSYSENDLMALMRYLTDHYSEEELIHKISMSAGLFESEDPMRQDCCYVYGMLFCLECLEDQMREAYFDGFLRLFSEYIESRIDADPDALMDRCMAIVGMIEGFEEVCAANGWLKALAMTALDRTAEWCAEAARYDWLEAVYRYQKRKLTGYSEWLDVSQQIDEIDQMLEGLREADSGGGVRRRD